MKKKQSQRQIDARYNHRIVNLLDEYLLDQARILKLGSKTGSDLVKLSKHYQITGSAQTSVDVEALQAKFTSIPIKQLDVRALTLTEKYDCIYSNKILATLTPNELAASLKMQAEHLTEEGMLLVTLPYGDKPFDKDGQLMQAYNETTITQLIPDCLRIDMLDSYYERAKDDSLLLILKKRTESTF